MSESDDPLPHVSGEVTDLILQLLRQEERPDVDELCRQHPPHEDEIRRRFDAYAQAMAAFRDSGAQLSDDHGDPAWTAFLDQLQSRGPGWSRYRDPEELAHGGMGVILRVYDEDLRRHLAMKRMLDRDAEEVTVGRFFEEAQVGGQLEHPGIVPVHEVGVDQEGHLYFTMKLVEGEHLGVVLERVRAPDEGWTIVRTLGILQRACEAVAYAHSKGVIHRDLKPENIMVGRFGETYVMDWGLARVFGRHDAVHSDRRDLAGEASPLLTLDGETIGTPYFMSPEQAQGRLEAIGPGTDVYAMGCILYQVLAGKSPYERADRTTSRQVLDSLLEGPPRSVRELNPGVPPELEAICERAMARDIGHRYPTMAELGEDLRSFQENRVVKAHATGPVAELRKWVARNRAVAATATAAALILVTLTTFFVVRLQAERNAAEESAEIAEAINRFLTDDLLAAVAPSAEAGAGRDVRMREVLDEAARRIEGRFVGKESVEASLRTTLGTTYHALGEFARAAPHLERALEIHERTLGPEDRATITSINHLARTYNALGRFADAEPLADRTAAISQRRFGADDPLTLESVKVQARVWHSLSRYDEAAALLERLAEASRRSLGDDHPETLDTIKTLSGVYVHLGRSADAEGLLEEALRGSRRALGAEHPDTLDTANSLGVVWRHQGRLDEAEALYEESLEAARDVLGDDHPETLYILGNLADLHEAREEWEEAERLYLRVLETWRRISADDHPRTISSLRCLAQHYDRADRYDLAVPLYEEALGHSLGTHGEDHPKTLMIQQNLGTLYHELERYEEALPLYEQSLAGMRQTYPADSQDVMTTMFNLSLLYATVERYDESERLARELFSLTPEDAPGYEDAEHLLQVILDARESSGDDDG